MTLIHRLSRSLAWKLFFSYLLIILVAVIVVAGTANFQAGNALSHHIADMEAALRSETVEARDLEASFLSAINEVISVALVAAMIAAVLVSS